MNQKLSQTSANSCIVIAKFDDEAIPRIASVDATRNDNTLLRGLSWFTVVLAMKSRAWIEQRTYTKHWIPWIRRELNARGTRHRFRFSQNLGAGV